MGELEKMKAIDNKELIIALDELEKELRTNGIREELITKYNNMAMDYQKQIEFSKELCGINFKQK